MPDPFTGSRYRAIEMLSSGETGDLYVVEHLELGKRFAAKLLHVARLRDARAVDRLRLEAQSLGRLRHPNVVGITGFEHTATGTPFIVMELLKGRTLAEDLETRHQLPLGDALDWAKQLLSALEAVHAIGVVHRDLSPSNVFLHQTTTGTVIPKLVDFGSVRVQTGLSERAPAPLAVPTKTGTVLGAPQFSSPELAQGRAPDARTDVYQFGLLFYLMLTGRGAFDGRKSDPRSGSSDATSPPDPPSRHVAARLPEGLDQLVLRALAWRPEDRFQSTTELRQQLCELVESVTLAPPRANPGTPTRVLLFLGLAALATLLVLGVAHLLGVW